MKKQTSYTYCLKYLLSAISVITVFSFANAQGNNYSLKWEEVPARHSVHNKFTSESAVVLLDSRLHEYVEDTKEGVVVNVILHRLIKINDEKGIEMYNKVYVPVTPGSEDVSIQARTITPSGKIIDLPQSKILDAEEEGRAYKKFAFEGVEKGSEVEYISTIKKKPYFFGLEFFQTSAAPVQRAEFMLVVPSRLVFDVKGYHGFSVDPGNVVNDKRIVIAIANDIPAMEEEKYAVTTPNTTHIQYKLSYNNAKDGNVRMFTWNDFAKNAYNAYTTFSEKEDKAVQGFLKEINIPSTPTQTEKIVLLQDYIKNHINTREDITGEEVSQLDQIVKTKNADNEGTSRLYIALFTKLNIPFQIVYPSKRDELVIEQDFENFRNINEMIFMFPSTGKFLSPTNKITRYPFIDPYWAATRGIFLKGTSIGSFKTAMPSFDSIPIEPYEKNYINLESTVKFNSTFDTALLHAKQIWGGYGALPYRPAYTYLPKDRLADFNKEIVKALSKSDAVDNIKVQNSAMTDFAKDKPLIVEADIKSAELVERAGNKLLIKVGEVIGPQVEMYQPKPRQLPIVMEYPHALDRNITLVLPAGYQVKNLNDLKFNVVSGSNGAETMGFVSTYTVNESEVKINVHEFYKQLSYPVSDFDEFKKVINAAADFNKVVLILEKK